MSAVISPVTIVVDDGEPMRGEFRVERERIVVHSSSSSKPDPSWSHVDSRGHYHAWSAEEPGLPTLRVRTTQEDEDGPIEYGDDVFVRVEYLCLLCDEVVEPRWVTGPDSTSIPGRTSYEVAVYGDVPMGRRVSVRVETSSGAVYFGIGEARSYESGSSIVRSYLTCGPMARQLDRPKVGAR